MQFKPYKSDQNVSVSKTTRNLSKHQGFENFFADIVLLGIRLSMVRLTNPLLNTPRLSGNK
jgi:hypothetical protein